MSEQFKLDPALLTWGQDRFREVLVRSQKDGVPQDQVFAAMALMTGICLGRLPPEREEEFRQVGRTCSGVGFDLARKSRPL